jgi:hypothetical protein
MKKLKKLLSALLCLAGLLVPVCNLFAQEKNLPEIKLPEISYKPNLKKGWVGQFVYQLNFNDSTGTGKGKNRVYYHLIINRTNSGYVELPTEIRGAIRSNQPDKNNAQRYESWIGSGTKNCWSKHDQTDTAVVPSGSMVTDAITGRLEKFSRYTSGSDWVKGWISHTDLQIDHTTGKYSFAVPFVDYYLEGDEAMLETTFQPEKKKLSNRKENKSHGLTNLSYLGFGEWNKLEGSFKEGQQEIIIRERIPVVLGQSYNNNKLPVKKGFMDFYLVLKKVG